VMRSVFGKFRRGEASDENSEGNGTGAPAFHDVDPGTPIFSARTRGLISPNHHGFA
jgi:hypothetical protein